MKWLTILKSAAGDLAVSAAEVHTSYNGKLIAVVFTFSSFTTCICCLNHMYLYLIHPLTFSCVVVTADELVPDSWRVKNANDIVTRVPSLLGYHHIGAEVQMFEDGQLTISRESSDDLREGTFVTDIISKIKGKY